MPSVRYKNGVKLAGGLYFSGAIADRVDSFTGSDWESSVFKLEVTLPVGSLDFGGGTFNSGVTEDTLVAVRNPWMWTRTDSTDQYTGNWAVIYGDGTVTRQGTGTHTYPSDGVYQFSIVGSTGLVPHAEYLPAHPERFQFPLPTCSSLTQCQTWCPCQILPPSSALPIAF